MGGGGGLGRFRAAKLAQYVNIRKSSPLSVGGVALFCYFCALDFNNVYMFSKETYTQRRAELKRRVGSGLILLLGNDEVGMNYADNTYHFRQDSSFLYYFGLHYAGLNAVIDVDNDEYIIFGDEL